MKWNELQLLFKKETNFHSNEKKMKEKMYQDIQNLHNLYY